MLNVVNVCITKMPQVCKQIWYLDLLIPVAYFAVSNNEGADILYVTGPVLFVHITSEFK